MTTALAAVFFDLDGTLLDTAPDLADAYNQVLHEYQHTPVPLTKFRQWVHGGALMIIRESLQIDPDHPQYSTIRATFFEYYRQRIIEKTQLFPGIDHILDYLDQIQTPWGIVTNKLAQLTQPLTDHFGFTSRCCCIVHGDTLPIAKPHPAPLLHACELAGVNPTHCLYVGDTLGDIQAAHAAGMVSIAVGYGYHPNDSNLETWQAHALAATPADLLSLLKDFFRT